MGGGGCSGTRVCAGFSAHRVPPELDAVVIGSGMGGLAAAGTLAKAGKRVLVLEQHDQAGGCCHTFQEQGTEFDVGKDTPLPRVPCKCLHSLQRVCSVHTVCTQRMCTHCVYSERMQRPCCLRAARVRAQRTHASARMRYTCRARSPGHATTPQGDPQQMMRLPDPYDEVCLGPRRYQLRSGKAAFAAALEEQFPAEKAAIREFMRLSKGRPYHDRGGHVVIGEGCPVLGRGLAVPVPPNHASPSPSPGTAPRDSSFLVNMLMVHHYQRGAWYPRGGASEIAFHAVPLIERAGGAVLVRAPVTRILVSPTGTAAGER
ncbi:all-trans-retinol 13,14-reductase-like [Morphnus guianensis]